MKRTCWVVAWLLLCVAGGGVSQAKAARPDAARLLPVKTVVFVQVGNIPQTVEALGQISIGQMIQDPQFKPLAERLYGVLVEAGEPLRERMGVTLSELLAVPTGEFAFAVVPQEEGPPAIVIICDVAEHSQAFTRLIEEGQKLAEQNGLTPQTEMVGDVKVNVLAGVGRRNRDVSWCVHQGALVISTQLPQLKSLLDRATGEIDEGSLADEPHFASTVASGTFEDMPPHATVYINPIELIRTLGQGNTGTQLALALLPALGLDGIAAAGATMRFGADPFDSMMHLHLWLDHPRSGALEVISLEPVDTTPERWIPADAARYTTFAWDFERMYQRIALLFDSFRGKGAFQGEVDRRLRDTDISLQEQVLPALAGRISLAAVIRQPITLASQGQLLVVHLRDGKAFQGTFDKIVTLAGDKATRETYGSQTYYRFEVNQPDAFDQPDESEAERQKRMPAACLAGDYVLLSDRTWLLQAALRSNMDDESLAESLDYKLVTSWAARHTGTKAPCLFRFERPEEGMRMAYELAFGENVQGMLKGAAERSRFLGNVRQAIEENPPPPFESLVRYLAPTGGVLVDNESGIHYTAFSLKRTAE